MMIVEAIFILTIIINLPYILAFIVGVFVGLGEAVAESVNDGTADSSSEEKTGAELMAGVQEPVFFSGCKTPEDYKDRYRALMKIYHPDGEHGDVEVTKQINNEYRTLTERDGRSA